MVGVAGRAPTHRPRANTEYAEIHIMAEIRTMSVPTMSIDFEQEALTAAVNEACASSEANRECSLSSPCPECQALAAAIKRRLMKAFIAGQMSMQQAVTTERTW